MVSSLQVMRPCASLIRDRKNSLSVLCVSCSCIAHGFILTSAFRKNYFKCAVKTNVEEKILQYFEWDNYSQTLESTRHIQNTWPKVVLLQIQKPLKR